MDAIDVKWEMKIDFTNPLWVDPPRRDGGMEVFELGGSKKIYSGLFFGSGRFHVTISVEATNVMKFERERDGIKFGPLIIIFDKE